MEQDKTRREYLLHYFDFPSRFTAMSLEMILTSS